jgi:hypothetical protein
MTRDPIKYRGGENLMRYVEGDPVRYLDRTGLQDSAVHGIDDSWTRHIEEPGELPPPPEGPEIETPDIGPIITLPTLTWYTVTTVYSAADTRRKQIYDRWFGVEPTSCPYSPREALRNHRERKDECYRHCAQANKSKDDELLKALEWCDKTFADLNWEDALGCRNAMQKSYGGREVDVQYCENWCERI